jgi:hypothetical protein
MKWLCLPGFLLCLLLVFGARRAGYGKAPEADRRSAERSFTIHLDAPPAVVFPLFGPVAEREWSPEWTPRMIFPSDGSEPARGAVFSTSDEHGEQTWVLTAYDRQLGEIAYCIFAPGLVVSEIEIHLRQEGKAQTSAEVLYRHTALSPGGDLLVARLAEHHAAMGPHWERAINEALHKRTKNAGR